MKQVAFLNLGCTKNIVDGEKMASFMEECNFKIIDSYEEADVIVVNTCTFIQEASEESINSILEMNDYKKTGKCSTLVVAGCLSERYREKISSEIPEVDLWVGLHSWAKELNEYFKVQGEESHKRVLSEPIHSQYLKISDGCSHTCTFCIIPSFRGKFVSRPMDKVIAEAQWMYEQGVRECIAVSQDTTFYGKDIGTTLAELLRRLVAETEFPWIRMMYLYPSLITDELLDVVSSNDRICSYFDMPLQHVSEPVLRAMKRTPVQTEKYYDLINNIRKRVPDATIRTTFILGFPGETEEDFDALVKFVEWAKFDKLGVFPYSPEEGTPAAEMENTVDIEIARERCEILMEVQQRISAENVEKNIGRELEVIIDRVSDNPDYAFEARTKGDAPEVDGKVYIDNSDAQPGDLQTVRIIDADDYDLFAEPIANVN